ncbi:MAG: response regulator [Sulfurospirillaceae bacterium]|nr:response regulator [Sulfurospirillaceae bacterium]MDD2826975.1 response regulator [Sulfurospirillaceae bacterium]
MNCKKITNKISSPIVASILVVEDSKFINNYISSGLSKLGHTCTQAFALQEAITQLFTTTFDLIILDLHLPDGEGEELLSAIHHLSDTKIVVFTSDDDQLRRDELFRYGVIDYFIKDKKIIKTISEIHQLIQRLEKNKGQTILIVDDSAVVHRQLSNLFKPRNYNLLIAKTVQEALPLMKEHSIDLVILDLELPGMNGAELLDIIKKNPHYIALPVLVLSGHNDAHLISKLYKLGASEFLKKPFVNEEISLKVDFWIDYGRKTNELACQQAILMDYKTAIDSSSIVSKTNAKGIITYVNPMFCTISGYREEELIGKPHNIVRHPDMPQSVFETLWKTIQAKKPWHGVIKNRKKDGMPYYVDTFIHPILDGNNNLIEYIGIRTDITEHELFKEKLRYELDISDSHYQEALNLHKEYEKAIQESTVLTRIDTSRRIIYANELFCETMGYTLGELKGQTHDMMHHPDNIEQINTMWEIVEAGKIWKGTLQYIHKDGHTVWFDTVMLPIYNAHNEIIEYMAIRHNITELIRAHYEIEETQKELIFRMSEVAESRNKETGNHIRRVAFYSRLLALKAGLPFDEAHILFTASPMHDIGKIAIPDHILLKPGKFEPEEWEVMKKHSEIGFNILHGSNRPILQAAAIVAHEHHEKYDGTGYPRQLSGEEIHIFGRITAIADAFDALGSIRPYKKAWELPRILELFEAEKGKHFDPKLMELFLENLDEFLMIRDKFTDQDSEI